MADPSPGFRRRRRTAGAAVLLDETAALLGADPGGWAARALLPSLPLALMGLLFVHLHRVAWAREAWGAQTTFLSLAVSSLVVLALAVRGMGQGLAAREVARQLDPQRGAALPDADRPALAALGILCAAACAGGFGMAVLPGFLAVAFFLPAFAVCACEGRDASSTLSRLGRLTSGTLSKGFFAGLLFSLLWLFAWADVVVGTQAALVGVRMLTGADVDVLARLLGPSSLPFLLSSAVLAGFLLDGVWCVYSAVFYVDARLGQSGADLLDRWEELRPGAPGAPGASAGLASLGLLVLALSFPALPAVAQEPTGGAAFAAEEDQGVGGLGVKGEAEILLEGADLELLGEVDWELLTGEELLPEAPELYLRDLQTWRAELERELVEYETTGFEDQDVLRDALRYQTTRRLQVPGGSLDVDASILADELPEWIHTEETAAQARIFLTRLDAAIARLDALVSPEPPPEDDTPLPASQDARTLLQAELETGDYELGEERAGGDAFRDSFQERLRVWLEELWRSMTAYEPQPRTQPQGVLPTFDGRIVMAAVAALLALVLVLFLLGTGRTLRIAAPEPEGGPDPLGGDLPDARARSPLGWRGHADQLAAQGRHREAIRAQFLAVLARLDRTGEIDYRQERTNGEHLRSFRGKPPRHRHFGDATWGFEVAWYGEADVGPVDYEAMSRVCDALVIVDASPTPTVAAVSREGAPRG